VTQDTFRHRIAEDACEKVLYYLFSSWDGEKTRAAFERAYPALDKKDSNSFRRIAVDFVKSMRVSLSPLPGTWWPISRAFLQVFVHIFDFGRGREEENRYPIF
jgi:hypothetical protein